MKRAPRSGYTLVEIVIALLVLTVAALGLASGAAVIGREIGATSIRERATRTAVSRLEMIRAQCSSAQSGGDNTGSLASTWTVDNAAGGPMSVVESITYPTPNGPRTRTFRAVFWCNR